MRPGGRMAGVVPGALARPVRATGERPVTAVDAALARVRVPDPWTLLGWVGWVVVACGVAALLLPWYPLRPGNADWTLATMSRSLEALPLLALGLGVSMASAAARSRDTALTAIGVALVVLVVLLLTASGTASFTLASLDGASGLDAARRAELQRMATRTMVLQIGAALCALGGGVTALRHAAWYRARRRV